MELIKLLFRLLLLFFNPLVIKTQEIMLSTKTVSFGFIVNYILSRKFQIR